MSASQLGSAITLPDLDIDPYPVLARLRAAEPVAWVPVLDGWLVTRRDLCVSVMRDAELFTVDDPRFSTARVVGPSMLSLDGAEHRRHREPFAAVLHRPEIAARFGDRVTAEAERIVGRLQSAGQAEVRRQLAGPLAVSVVGMVLDLADVDSSTVLAWYDDIVAAVDRVSKGGEIGTAAPAAVDALRHHVGLSVAGGGMLAQAAATLEPDEVTSNAAVMMFGGIETSEGMTTSLFWHLLSDPGQFEQIVADRGLITNAVEESLRLEPAAGRVDRYATRDTELGGSFIQRGDLVIVSLTAANRDPAVFEQPDRFDVSRVNARSHLTFAQGPHACIGLHLARWESEAALRAAIEGWPNLRLAPESTAPTGVVFRKPRTMNVRWDEG